ncbi:MAG: hypothetical protein F4058_05220 [Rhodothermaceae bacterium]|nr:hypothetical protein [Rhodothermaceae bacterium]
MALDKRSQLVGIGIRLKGAQTCADWILGDDRVLEGSQFSSGHTTEPLERSVFNDHNWSLDMDRKNTNVDGPFRFAVRASQRQRRLLPVTSSLPRLVNDLRL